MNKRHLISTRFTRRNGLAFKSSHRLASFLINGSNEINADEKRKIQIWNRYNQYLLKKLKQADLSNARFEKVYLEGVNLENALLMGASFSNCNLNGAHLCNSNFYEAVFNNTKLIGADLSFANFSNVKANVIDFRGTNLRDTDFKDSTILKPNFDWSNYKCAKDLNVGLERIPKNGYHELYSLGVE